MPKKGYKATEEHKRKISNALRGRKPKNFDEFLRRSHETPKPKGPDHPRWKGDNVGYSALHAWIRRELGTPPMCSRCGSTKAKRYEWSNISKEYKRDLDDWERLCISCHRKEGFEDGEYTIWNKGLSVQTNTGRTHIKLGEHRSPETEFKPGIVPWNKYLEPRVCVKCKKDFQPRVSKQKYCTQRCYWDSLMK
ncbi:MAG: hypothetical protein KAI64_01350 [Thermoplasmata archaeon]|nr:hypothetical protein [Thermoplasmata archaeon]